MAVRIAAGLALAALIGGSIFFVKMSQSSSPEKAGEAKKETGDATKPKLSFDLKEADTEFDFKAIPEVIAEIDGKPVSSAEYVKELKNFQDMAKKSNQPIGKEYMQQVQDQILEKIVNTSVLVLKAEKAGVTVDPAEITKNLERGKASMGGEDKFKEFLQSRGMTLDSLKLEIARSMRIKALLDKEIGAKINITDKDVSDFYEKNPEKFEAKERVHASHILVMTKGAGAAEGPDAAAKPAEDKEAKAKAEAILAKLKAGADFAETAKNESDDKGSGGRGGDLGFFTRDQMVPEFADAAFSLEPGKLSGLVKSQFGYHIIKVAEKKPAGKMPFDEVKESIRQRLKMGKSGEAVGSYIEALHKEFKVKVAGADGKLAAAKPRPKAPSNPHN